jgi:predicted GIY-YIG superfamily endonuclease
LEDGLIDECPRCGQFKYVEYDLCLPCQREIERQPAGPQRPSKPRTEYSPAWGKRDSTAEQFFVYILKLDSGGFYVGQTRELRERLSEHRDGKEGATAGRNPRLAYFEILQSREDVAQREVQLKQLKQINEREIRRMILKFQDWIRLVEPL